MTLYEWLVELLLPVFGDISATDGALQTFGQIFWLVMSCVVAHFCIYVPYRGILHLLGWKRWRDG